MVYAPVCAALVAPFSRTRSPPDAANNAVTISRARAALNCETPNDTTPTNARGSRAQLVAQRREREPNRDRRAEA